MRYKPSNPRKYLISRLREELKISPEAERSRAQKFTSPGVMNVPAHHLIRLSESTRSITALIVPKDTINAIIEETLELLKCDRVSIFIYDPKIKMLVLTASNMEKPIRVNPGQGIAGHVFTSGETVNIPDCYADSRFDPSFDQKTGYRTNSMVVMPIQGFNLDDDTKSGFQVLGVLQAINKLDGQGTNASDGFTDVDELMMGHLTQHAGIALQNSEIYREAISASERANGLLHLIQSMSQDLGSQSLILMITMHANELVQADRSTVFLVDEARGQLWSVASDSGKEIRIPRSAGSRNNSIQISKFLKI